MISGPSATASVVSPESALAWLDAECARQSLLDYCPLVSFDGYEQTPHIRALIAHLEAVERGEIPRLIVEMPPRSSKSTHVSRLFPSWYIGRHPERYVIEASYGKELAVEHGRAVRDLLGHPRYPFDVQLRADVKGAGRWMTSKGGGLVTAGVDGGLTGHGGHLNVLDDPIKDRQEAESDLVREHTWVWYQEVFRTRFMLNGAAVVLGTRWHEDDLIGRLLNSPGASDWVRLKLPYFAEEDDPIGREVGAPLHIFGDVPSVAKGEISSRGFSALYQQNPSPAEGAIFKLAWLQHRYDPRWMDDKMLRHREGRLADDERWLVVQTIDTATKDGVGNDYSCIATWATDGIRYYLVDVWRARVDYPDLKRAVVEQFWKYHPFQIAVEDTTHGRPLVQEFQKMAGAPPVAPYPVSGSKVTRVEAISGWFEGGYVALPGRRPEEEPLWLEPWMREHLSFPNAAHDDQVDCTSIALTRLTLREPVPMVIGKVMV